MPSHELEEDFSFYIEKQNILLSWEFSLNTLKESVFIYFVVFVFILISKNCIIPYHVLPGGTYYLWNKEAIKKVPPFLRELSSS